jgi:hypothetical protein
MTEKTDLLATAETQPQPWQYTTTPPAGRWMLPGFDTSKWKTGKAGFGAGNPAPPSAPIQTAWTTPKIWIRRTFELTGLPAGRVYLRLYHDEDCVVYINGTEVARFNGYSTSYFNLPLATQGNLIQGENVIAIECQQTGGGQFIDAGLFIAK